MGRISSRSQSGAATASLLSSARYVPLPARAPWFTTGAKPSLRSLTITWTVGNCSRSISTDPSSDALSMTIVSTSSDG